MFQLYRDGLEDLLSDYGTAEIPRTKSKKISASPLRSGGWSRKNLLDEDLEESVGTPARGLKITLAEHSASGLVEVQGAKSVSATSAREVMTIFSRGIKRFFKNTC